MAYQPSDAAKQMIDFWKDPRNIPFKEHLISKENGELCMCAQGQVLYKISEYTADELFELKQVNADREVAKTLNISIAHSVLLRLINDGEEGAPQDVLQNPQKYLGPNFEKVLEFWHKLDTLSEEQWKIIIKRYNELDDNAGNAAFESAFESARDAKDAAGWWAALLAARSAASGDAAWDAAWVAAAQDVSEAAGYATCEIIGSHILLSQNKPLTFLPMFENL